MNEEEPLPLTSLCGICHVNPLKYTCPRCAIHTCSLPCVQLHKKRAQCSGIRNPGEYAPRSELLTPAGFDRDFNFITSLERGLQRADDVLAERKIDLRRPPPPPPLVQGWGGRDRGRGPGRGGGGAGMLERAAEERGVCLIRAPLGLNRRKENRSRVSAAGGGGGGGSKEGEEGGGGGEGEDGGSVLVWTVEWISWNGRRRVQNFDERKTLGEAYAMCHPTVARGKKRKRGGGVDEREDEHEKQENPPSMAITTDDYDGTSPLPPDAQQEKDSERKEQPEKEQPEKDQEGKEPENKEQRKEPETESESKEEKEPGRKEQPEARSEPTSEPTPRHIHLYLHRPQTTSKIKCLIPLSTTSTIQEALRGKKIVEFPTIYVRNERPEELPLPFMLESKYLDEYGEDIVVQAQAQTQS